MKTVWGQRETFCACLREYWASRPSWKDHSPLRLLPLTNSATTIYLHTLFPVAHPPHERLPQARCPQGVHNAAPPRSVLRRLARRARQAQAQSLPHPQTGPRPPEEDASRSRKKKSPALGTVAEICAAWAEAKPTNFRTVAHQLSALAGHCSVHELTALHFQSLIATWKQRHTQGTVRCYRDRLANLVRYFDALTGTTLTTQILHVRKQ